jgi:hypothetical protein
LGLGVANVSANSDKAGDPAFYGVVTCDQKKFRLHGGYLRQDENDALFAGVDLPVRPKTTTARFDWIQANDGEDSVYSAGFIHTVSPKFIVEAWVSNTTAGNVHNTVTIKFDFPLSLTR